MLNIQQQWGVAFRGRAFLVIIEAVFQTFFDLLGIGLFTENNIAQDRPKQATGDKEDDAKCAWNAHP